MKPGDKVRKKANPSRVGVLTAETSGSPARLRYLVVFPDAEEFVLADSLEVVAGQSTQDPFDCISQGRFGPTDGSEGYMLIIPPHQIQASCYSMSRLV